MRQCKFGFSDGLQGDPYNNLGRLRAEIWRAARLVVDTGIHYKRWNRQQAIDYMIAYTGLPESAVVTEIEGIAKLTGHRLCRTSGWISRTVDWHPILISIGIGPTTWSDCELVDKPTDLKTGLINLQHQLWKILDANPHIVYK